MPSSAKDSKLASKFYLAHPPKVQPGKNAKFEIQTLGRSEATWEDTAGSLKELFVEAVKGFPVD